MTMGLVARPARSLLSRSSRSSTQTGRQLLHGSRARVPSVVIQSAFGNISPLLASRQFSSTPVAAGWLPGFLGGGKKADPVATERPTASAAETTSSSSATTTEPIVTAAPPPPAPPVPSVSQTPAVEPTSAVEAAAAASDAAATPAATYTLPGSDIFSGTLDLTSLAGSWGLHPIMRLQSMFLHLHESFPLLSATGLPWYILIPSVTLVLRLLLFGFQVRAQANAARMAKIQPQMLAGMEKVKQAKARGDPAGAQAAQMAVAHLMAENKVNPLRNLVFPLAQASVFMTMFFAIRGLAQADIPSLMNEGAAWIQDLTKPDPYWALPIASTALTLATLEVGVDSSTQVQTTTTKNMKLFFRIGMILALPFIAYFPAALLLYWVSNNTISLLQSLLLKQTAVRNFFNIPIVPPKPLPGQPGYVAEPSFSDAFKNMQTGAMEKWEETKEKAEKDRLRKEAFESKGVKRAEMYEPKATAGGGPSRMQQVVSDARAKVSGDASVLEGANSGAKTSTIEAVPSSSVGAGREAEKARRVQAARERRRRQ